MQNLDWNKCFQQVRGVELRFPFVPGLAVGLCWGCLRPTTQRVAQPRAGALGTLEREAAGEDEPGPAESRGNCTETGPRSAQVE